MHRWRRRRRVGQGAALPPGKNPFVDEIAKRYGIPPDAAMGGAQTMYPEYREKIRSKFVRPAKCTINCG